MVLPLDLTEGQSDHILHHEELHGRTLTAGAGLTGGGNLTEDRSFAVSFGTTAGTVAQGNDSRITGAIQSSLADAKGDLLVASANDTVARVGVGSNGQLLIADSSQSAGVRWTDRTISGYDPAMDGLIAVAADPAVFRSNSNPAPGWAVRVRIPAGRAITGAIACVGTAGTVGAGGVNGFAILDDTGAVVTSTVDDNNLWATQGARSKAFPSPVAAQTADRYVYVCLRINGYSAGPGLDTVDGTDGGRLNGLRSTNRRSIPLTGSSWDAIDPTAGPSNGGFMPFIGVY